MNITHELEKPFTYSWSLVITLVIILAIVVLVYVFIKYWPFFYSKFSKYFKKAQTPSLKALYLHKLDRLLKDVETNKIDIREAYTRLSVIIRGFIKKTTGINVLTLTKKEVKKMNIHALGSLMEEYYPPEFSKYSKGDIIKSINRTKEVIREWN